MSTLDYSKFKKISSDKHTTVLQHKDGHELKITHSALPKKMQDELHKLPMAEGGKVKPSGAGVNRAWDEKKPGVSKMGELVRSGDKSVAKIQAQKTLGEMDRSPKPKLQGLADGGEPRKMFADQGDVATDETGAYNDPTYNKEHLPIINAFANWLGQKGNDLVNTYNQNTAQQAATLNPNIPRGTVQRAPTSGAGPQEQIPNSPMPLTEEPGDSTSTNPAAPGGQPEPKSGDSTDEAQEPANSSTSAEDAQAAQQPEATSQQPSTPQPQISPIDQQVMQHMAEDQAFKKDLVGHITPETYSSLADKSSMGKVGSIFGLLLSGFGSGLSHQPNMLMDMMNKEIQNDLTAQTQSNKNASNLWNMSMQNELNKGNVALRQKQSDLTNAQAQGAYVLANKEKYNLDNMKMNRVYMQNLTDHVATLQGPARQQADQMLAMLGDQVDKTNVSLASQAAMAGAKAKMLMGQLGQSGQQAGAQNNEAAFQQRQKGLNVFGGPEGKTMSNYESSRHIPGFTGEASAEIAPNTAKELKGMAQYDDQLGRYTAWAKAHSGVLPDSPENIAIINQGKTLAKALQSTYRENSLNTVYRPGEQGLLSQTIPDNPTKFLNKWRVIPQLDALRSENFARMNSAAKTEGLGSYVGSGGGNPGGGGNIQPMGGVNYQKVPGGWKRVK